MSIWIDAIFEKFLSKREPRLVGLDDEVGGRHDEVQKGSCDLSNWTLKRREDTMKSKKEVKAGWIGRWSGGKTRWSPKRKSKQVRLDVEAGGGHDEVQKGSQSWLDWTLKQREGTMKSKKEVEAWKNRKFKEIQKSWKKLKKAVDIILM